MLESLLILSIVIIGTVLYLIVDFYIDMKIVEAIKNFTWGIFRSMARFFKSTTNYELSSEYEVYYDDDDGE